MNYKETTKQNLVNRLEELRLEMADTFDKAFEISTKTPDVLKFDNYMLYEERELSPLSKFILMDMERQPHSSIIGKECYNRLGISKAVFNNHMREMVDEGYVLRLNRYKYTINKIY